METVQLSLVQTLVPEPCAPEPKRSGEFLNILTGKETAATAESPPGQPPPPAATPAVEEAEISEPNAQSQEPDFHSQHDPAAKNSDDSRTADPSEPQRQQVNALLSAQLWVAAIPSTTETCEAKAAPSQGPAEAASPVVSISHPDLLAQPEQPAAQANGTMGELHGSTAEAPPPPAPQPVQTEPAPQGPFEAPAVADAPAFQQTASSRLQRAGEQAGRHDPAALHEAAPEGELLAVQVLGSEHAVTNGADEVRRGAAPADPDRSAPTPQAPPESQPSMPDAAGQAATAQDPATPKEQSASDGPKPGGPEPTQQPNGIGTEQTVPESEPQTQPQSPAFRKAQPAEHNSDAAPRKGPELKASAESADAKAPKPVREAENSGQAFEAEPVGAEQQAAKPAERKPSASGSGGEAQPVAGAALKQETAASLRTPPAPDRAEPLVNSRAADVIRQIVDRVETLAAAHRPGGVVVRLEPHDLGTITLAVRSIGDQIEAHIAASDERVRTALDTSKSHLAQAMEAKGFSLRSVTVTESSSTQSQADFAGSHRGQPQQQPRQDQQAFRQHANMWAFAYASPASRSTRGGFTWTRQSGLDLWT